MTEGRMLFLIVLVATFVPATLQAQACESLSKLVSPTVLITLAKTIDAGAFTPTGSTTMLPDLPAFCRVAANLKPTPDSDIRAEIWLPISGWNGKFVAASARAMRYCRANMITIGMVGIAVVRTASLTTGLP
jgi:feruloyl esterase